MSPTELAKAFVAEILSGGSIWLFLILTGTFAGFGAFFGRYLGIKATNLATKEDFTGLQNQLDQSTRLVEAIRSEIARKDWAEREWAAIRIRKIEELLSSLYVCEEYLNKMHRTSISGKLFEDASPFDHSGVIAEAYLPELSLLVSQYTMQCRKIYIALNQATQKILAIRGENGHYDPETMWQGFIEKNGYAELLALRSQVIKSAGSLLKKISSAK